MIEKIQKRDGRVITFVPEKITRAIFLAASAIAKEDGVEADYELAERITDQVVGYLNSVYKHTVPSVEQVQDAVVRVLIETGYARTSEAYILYRSERSRIRNLKTRLMKSIEEITFSDAKDSDMKRDNANIDGNTAMGTMLQYGSAVSKEYCLSQVINPKYAKMHEDGDIHIHDLDFMNMGTLTCCQIDLDKLFHGGFSTGHGFLREPQDIASYAALAAIAIQSNQNDQHGGQSIPAFDYYLANGVAKTFRKKYISNLNKAIELILGKDVDLREDVKVIEKEVGKKPTLDMDYAFLDALNAYLKKTFNTDDETVKKINTFTYKEARNETDKATYQAMEGFIHNLNTMHSRAGAQVPFSSINFGTDTSVEGRMLMKNLLLAQEAGLGNGETPIFPILIFKVKEGVNYNPGDPNYDLFKLSLRVSAKRLFPNFVFVDAPYNLQYYDPNDFKSEIATMGCRTRVLSNVNGPDTPVGRGNNSFTTINLPRLGIKHGVVGKKGFFDKSAFFQELDEELEIVISQLLERGAIQSDRKVKNFPFLMGQGVWIDSENLDWNDTLEEAVKHGTFSIGFIGLAECLVALIGEHHGESDDAQELGLEIVGYMRKKADDAVKKYQLNFSIIATPAEGLSGRFTKIDRKKYGEIRGVTDREYYTNSNHVPVYYPISAFEKIQKEAPYHEMTNAGHIAYVELDGDPIKNLDAFEEVVRCMKESGVGYGSINHPVDRDPVCGFSGVIDDNICPKCGRDEDKSEVKFDRIRRITGYLVGTLDRFNNGKAAEERDRLKHNVKED
ncbi:anaerobic ribonucleoside-triphosphate reductase [Breznakia sp. PF5-3]|uniref:anaerobic ribonucleoside triphosphate reductase n=1 Tax=unclassified Breznakia TaxID=2623764 RepID=UPI002405440C|nr:MULTISPECIES: anaerobic ribonucleoside triphosphate reductase [unclassified Breznakia]MDL2276764.1 anaerobic ribonucleoside triphosphate reductase [Breznakia sp. OttesenSCG-928-G09]MDF9825314.1 anaerobic ribonucleoside-triphosphate reductase [Breznakia sp. PM6-1]MDF9836203.1 anaerobic ribonucleoside-triphosphate reductase [Breznakia sp. PF5-3]MDF9838432.1 anaerobic ribonucleoside-triphosphate reductase [Breznakia sp. PFB2-8]MDF9860448.1 anaerobic ribonucleoside-triphosphate reductase [Brezn